MRFESFLSLSLITGALLAAPFTGCGGDGDENAGGAGGGTTSSPGGGGTGGIAGTGGAATGGSDTGGGGGTGGALPSAKCGTTMTFLVEAGNIQGVVVDAHYAYYAQNNGDDAMPGGIFRVALGQEKQKPVKLADSPQPFSLALAKDTLVFGDADGGIFTVPIAGGSAKKIAKTADAASHLIATDDTVYFSDTDGTKSVPVAGGTVTTLTDQVAFSLALWKDQLVLADYFGGQVFTVAKTGGTPTLIADMQEPLYPVVAGDAVVWANAGQLQDPTAANLTSYTAGQMPTSISSGAALFHPQAMVFDGTNFYVSKDSPAQLTKVPAAGGDPTVVSVLVGDSGLAFDDVCVYAAQPGKGLGMIAK